MNSSQYPTTYQQQFQEVIPTENFQKQMSSSNTMSENMSENMVVDKYEEKTESQDKSGDWYTTKSQDSTKIEQSCIQTSTDFQSPQV